jgi:hypothetical protein
MARSSAGKSTAPSRVRFIMLEAELAEGDLGQITQAIQNALRPANNNLGPARPISQRLMNAPPETEDSAPTEEAFEDITPLAENKNSPSRKTPVRKIRSPSVIDVDVTSEPSLASFAAKKNPSSESMKFLVVVAWFNQHRGIDAVGVDHVYTCYRALKWDCTMEDFSQPLRDLKRRQLLHKKGRGLYAINHLGLAEVGNLGSSP